MHPALLMIVTFALGTGLGWIGYLIAINVWYRRQYAQMLHKASLELCVMGHHVPSYGRSARYNVCGVCGTRLA